MTAGVGPEEEWPSIFPNSASLHTGSANQKHPLSAMLILYGSRPTCNEHLEGQRGESAYITTKVGCNSNLDAEGRLSCGNHRLITDLKSFFC